MGFARDDAGDDGTIGVPRRFPKPPDSAKRPEPPRAPAPARSTPVERYAPPPPPDRSELGPPSSGFVDHDDASGTLMPPRALRPRTPAPAPPPRPEADVERGRIPTPPLRPAPPATFWPDDDSGLAPGPIDPGWGSSSEFRTAPPGPGPASPPPPPSEFVDHPWTVVPAAKAPAPREPDPASIPPPRPAPPRADPKTPQGFSRAQPPPPPPARTGRPVPPPPPPRDEMRTMAIGGDLGREAPGSVLMLQYYDGAGHWLDLSQVQPGGHVVGRSAFRRNASTHDFLAVEHFRIFADGDRLAVEECETVNGVFRKVPPGTPVELADGTRFQVGQSVIEFRMPEPAAKAEPLTSPCGEIFRWRGVEPLAFLDFVGPDGESGLRFPLTKLDGTVIGREGDIALTGDSWASRSHARLVRQGSKFLLEDLGSTNGTFIRIRGRAPIKAGMPDRNSSGDVLLVGAVLIRVVQT